MGDGGLPLIPLFIGSWRKLYPKKDIPSVLILNIGREKYSPLRRFVISETGDYRVDEEKAIERINTETLPLIYGKDSIANLSRLLHAIDSERMLIVGDIIGTGKTQAIVQRILSTMLPESHLSFFYYFFDKRQSNNNEGTVNLNLPFLKTDGPPWSGRYPKVRSLQELDGDETDFLFSQKPKSHQEVLLSALREAERIFGKKKSTDPNIESLVERYFGQK